MQVDINGLADSYGVVGVSDLGNAIFDNVVFPAGQYIDLDGNIQPYNEVRLDAVTFSVSCTKEIVISKVAGREGSIKEYVTSNDYEIEIDAIIAPPSFTPSQATDIAIGQIPLVSAVRGATNLIQPNEPTELINNIALLERVPDRVPILCKFLQNNYQMNYVVILNVEISRLTADSYSLKMSLLSDYDIDLSDFS